MNRLILLNKDGEIIMQRGHGKIRPNEFIVDINEGERFVGISQQYPDPQRYYHCVQLLIASK
jgi:hypothetical protein